MNKKIIEIKYHMCDGCCMWSGIEDIYVTKSGEEVPEAFCRQNCSLTKMFRGNWHPPQNME